MDILTYMFFNVQFFIRCVISSSLDLQQSPLICESLTSYMCTIVITKWAHPMTTLLEILSIKGFNTNIPLPLPQQAEQGLWYYLFGWVSVSLSCGEHWPIITSGIPPTFQQVVPFNNQALMPLLCHEESLKIIWSQEQSHKWVKSMP